MNKNEMLNYKNDNMVIEINNIKEQNHILNKEINK